MNCPFPSINKVYAGAALGLCLLAAPLFADSVELRIATLAPAGSPQMRELEQAASEIRTRTDGRVTLKYFPGGEQGDERDFIRKINLGQLDGAAVSGVGLSMIDESIRVLEAPDLFESVEEYDYVADKMWPYFQRKFESKGFSLVDRGETGWTYFLTKDRVDSIAGLKAAKLWQWGDDALMGALFRKIGLNGVPLGMPEVDAALTSGRITGCYGSPLAAVSMQWYTKIRFMNSMPVNFGIGATVLSQRALARISTDDQKIISSISVASAKKLRKTLRKSNEDAKSTMVRRGVTVVAPAGSMEQDFARFAAAARQDLAGKMYSQAELDSVIRHREGFRAKRKPGPARYFESGGRSKAVRMATWLFSGAVFACVWGLGFLVAMHSRGRLREALAPAGILLASSNWLVSGAVFLSGNAVPALFGFHLPAGFLIGPLVLLYARFILRSTEGLRALDLLHALPSMAAVACLVWYHASSPEEQAAAIRLEGPEGALFATLNAGLKLSVLGYTAVVSAWFFRLIPREPRYLPLLFLYGAVIADLLIGIAGFALGQKALILSSAAGLPPILYGCFLAASRWPDMLGSLRADVTRRRYQKTRLLGLDVEGTVEELRRLMEEEKAFSDEDLTLAALARELGVTPHQLSQILNERLEKSFSVFVNEHRIREARDLIVREPERSLLSIGHAAGFNSKSAFNRAFRQVCGETPQQFRSSQKILSRLGK